jgi:hypothetical protein
MHTCGVLVIIAAFLAKVFVFSRWVKGNFIVINNRMFVNDAERINVGLCYVYR